MRKRVKKEMTKDVSRGFEDKEIVVMVEYEITTEDALRWFEARRARRNLMPGHMVMYSKAIEALRAKLEAERDEKGDGH